MPTCVCVWRRFQCCYQLIPVGSDLWGCPFKTQICKISTTITNVAGLYLASVAVADNYENPANINLLADGCFWFPTDASLNNANGAVFLPSTAGCPCDGTSCEYS